MLKDPQRLSNKEFMEVIEKGRVHHSPLFLMRAISGAQGVKFAAVAPKKVASTAVIRNHARRRMYEAVKPIFASVIPGTHAAIFSKTDLSKASQRDIEADLKELFAKAKISV